MTELKIEGRKFKCPKHGVLEEFKHGFVEISTLGREKLLCQQCWITALERDCCVLEEIKE